MEPNPQPDTPDGTEKSGSESNGRSVPQTRWVIGIGVLIIGGIIATPIITRFLEAWRQMVTIGCRHQLKWLSVDLRLHALKHEGRFPSKWSELELQAEERCLPRMLCCPYGGHPPGGWTNADLWADYHLIPGRTTNDPPDRILAIEALANHKGAGADVLYVDGSTQWRRASTLLTNDFK